MQKSLFALFFLLIAGQVKSQVMDLFNGFDLSAIQAGDSFALEIKNNGTEPATFYPLTALDSPGNYLFLSEENYFSYLKSTGNQIDALRAHARIVKSPYFFVGQKPVSELDNGSFQKEIAEKKYAFPQWFLTSCHYECGEFAAMGASQLIKSGVFEKDSIWALNLSDYHSLGEGIVNGDTLLIDFDSEMPRFLDTLPNGSYMAASDAYLHPEYFYQQSEYALCNENDSCWFVEKSTDSYVGFFQDTSVFARYANHEIEPQSMSGAWTLCAGCSIVFEWKAPEYVLDASDSNTALLFDSLMAIIGNQPIDTLALGAVAQALLGTPTREKAIAALNNFNVISAEELTDITKSAAYLYNNTTVKLSIPGRATGYASSDIQLPLAVNKITSENGLTIGGHSISPGSHQFKLWTDGGILDEKEDITIAADSFYHLTDLYISGNNSVEIELYYNHLLYGFLQGIKTELFSSTPNLTVTAYPDITSETQTQIKILDTVFPNPAQSELWVSSSGMLTNISGVFVLQLEQGVNDISKLSPGIYLFNTNSTTQKVVKF